MDWRRHAMWKSEHVPAPSSAGSTCCAGGSMSSQLTLSSGQASSCGRCWRGDGSPAGQQQPCCKRTSSATYASQNCNEAKGKSVSDVQQPMKMYTLPEGAPGYGRQGTIMSLASDTAWVGASQHSPAARRGIRPSAALPDQRQASPSDPPQGLPPRHAPQAAPWPRAPFPTCAGSSATTKLTLTLCTEAEQSSRALQAWLMPPKSMPMLRHSLAPLSTA